MFKRRRPSALIGAGLIGLLGPAVAADDADLVPVWKRDDGTAHIKLAAPKTLADGLVSVSYHLVAVNTALPTPEMVVAQFGVVCERKTREPVQLTHSHTTMFRLVRGQFVQDSDQALSPPLEVSLESNHDFAAMPAVVACARAVALAKPPR
jgi:hypothetical protein